jgi:nucleoside-diphosphate-sugar epimerase
MVHPTKSVRVLAEMIWHKVKGNGEELRIQEDPPFEHDVQFRLPDTHKAQEVLGFTAETSLDKVLDEVIPWVADAIERGDI